MSDASSASAAVGAGDNAVAANSAPAVAANSAPAVAANSAPAVAANPSPNVGLLESIRQLKEQQAAMKAARVKLTKDLRNACKRRNRLKKRARQLTDQDLVEVLQMRRDVVAAAGCGEPTAAAAGPGESDEPAADAPMTD